MWGEAGEERQEGGWRTGRVEARARERERQKIRGVRVKGRVGRKERVKVKETGRGKARNGNEESEIFPRL